MKRLIMFCLLGSCIYCHAQPLQTRIAAAMKNFLANDQLKHAATSVYIAEINSDRPVYALNEDIGLAPASTQKIFTAIAAFELLGKDYHYATTVGYNGNVKDGILEGDLVIKGTGDPTLGSWRYPQTRRDLVLNKIAGALQDAGIKEISGSILLDESEWSYQPLPGGWIWDDIGNYYGAGTWALNWNENQYDLLLQPGRKEEEDVLITGTTPALSGISFINNLKSGKPGSGDNGYIYLPPYTTVGLVKGTVPAAVKSFTISGSLPHPALQMGEELHTMLSAEGVQLKGAIKPLQAEDKTGAMPGTFHLLETIVSPSLDSMVYWFLQKSINLYGEALIKTIAAKINGTGSTEQGVNALQNFWKNAGIENDALNIMDGSGLSPQNRVTTKSMVTALQYARDKPWFSSFLKAQPQYNGMKMKSGTIGGAKAFTGYHTAANGKEYSFAIIVNNFSGSSGAVVREMYKVLDTLK